MNDLKFVDMTVLDTQQLHFEDESTLGRNDRRVATFTVCEMRRNGQLALFRDAHIKKALIPALNDLPSSERELKGPVSV